MIDPPCIERASAEARGDAQLPHLLYHRVYKVLPRGGCRGYGAHEHARGILRDRDGSIGKAGYLWETDIVDGNGNTVPQGEVGELAVRGPGVMKCYYKNPKATAEVLHGGWLYTGDMAKADEDGFIYLVDRKKDVIITGGENLYPVQIEDFLRANIKIKDVAVIGLPDERLGEIAAAIIELKPGMSTTEEEIDRWHTVFHPSEQGYFRAFASRY